MDLGVAGRNFAIVGGSTGMGFAAAQVLAEEGANVALLARDEARSRAKAEELERTHGTRAVAIGVDGSQSDDGMCRAIDAAAERLGPLRGLAVTAGPMNLQGPFEVHDEASWDWYYQVATAPEIGPLKKALSIIQYDGAHEELRRWNLRDAFPVKWVGPNFTTSASQVGIESLELAYAEFEMVARG